MMQTDRRLQHDGVRFATICLNLRSRLANFDIALVIPVRKETIHA